MWLQLIDFSKLRTLQIFDCEGVDDLLKRLIESKTCPLMRLHGLTLSFDALGDVPCLEAQFLTCISGLHFLHLSNVMEDVERTPFDIRCLDTHKHTLRDLYISPNMLFEDDTREIQAPLLSDVQWLSTYCPHLRQVAIAFPSLDIDDAFAGLWGEYAQFVVSPVCSAPTLPFG